MKSLVWVILLLLLLLLFYYYYFYVLIKCYYFDQASISGIESIGSEGVVQGPYTVTISEHGLKPVISALQGQRSTPIDYLCPNELSFEFDVSSISLIVCWVFIECINNH